jgi:hypothetical protein
MTFAAIKLNNIYNVYIALDSAPGQMLPFIHSLDVRPALASSEISPRLRETALLPAYHSTATSACFIVARLIVEIVQLLMGSDASEWFRDQHSVTSTIAYWNGNPGIRANSNRWNPGHCHWK